MSSGCRNHNPYPVRSGSSALSKSEVNLSTTMPKHSASKKPSTAPKRDRNAPVAASLDAFPSSKPNSRVNSAKSKAAPPPATTTRGSGDGEAVDVNTEPDCDSSSFQDTKLHTNRNRSSNNGNTTTTNTMTTTTTAGATRTPLPSGISLSSLEITLEDKLMSKGVLSSDTPIICPSKILSEANFRDTSKQIELKLSQISKTAPVDIDESANQEPPTTSPWPETQEFLVRESHDNQSMMRRYSLPPPVGEVESSGTPDDSPVVKSNIMSFLSSKSPSPRKQVDLSNSSVCRVIKKQRFDSLMKSNLDVTLALPSED
ncbi:unnamed protein product, partial [Trichobilharzia regenti]